MKFAPDDKCRYCRITRAEFDASDAPCSQLIYPHTFERRDLVPLRGRVVIRELFEDGTIWTPQGNPRERLTHRGVVLALGAPALTPSGAEVPYEYGVGDTVQFHFTATEKGRIAPWSDGKPALWMAWFEIDAVIEPICNVEYEYQLFMSTRRTTCRKPQGHDGPHVGEEKT